MSGSRGAVRCLLAAFMVGGFALGPEVAEGQRLMLGVKGGVNMADLSIDDPTGDGATESITGFVGGGFVELGLTGGLAVRAEGLVSKRGFADPTSLAEVNLDYVEIPVLLVARLGMGPIRPVLFGGPVFSVETGCELTATGVSSIECEGDVETETSEYGLAFGGGLEAGLGPLQLLLDGRYNMGLSNLDATGETDAKNRTWAFMAGLGFGIG
ncbi:MAG: porin family protein [Longimicrobiales bacterium]